MPRYYFPSWDGVGFLPDDDGHELENLDKAREMALRALCEMAAEVLPQAPAEHVIGICMTDGGETPIAGFRLTFQSLDAGGAAAGNLASQRR
jgi:hypothetical protein